MTEGFFQGHFFVDHTFLVALLFPTSSDRSTRDNHGKALSYYRQFRTWRPAPLLITTNAELIRTVGKLFRESGNDHEFACDALQRITASRFIRMQMLTKKAMAEAKAIFEDMPKGYTREYLDVTSFAFLKLYADQCRIRRVIAFHNHFREAAEIFGWAVW